MEWYLEVGPLGEPVNGTGALIKETPQELPCPLGHVRTQREGAASEPGSRLSLDIESTGLLILD